MPPLAVAVSTSPVCGLASVTVSELRVVLWPSVIEAVLTAGAPVVALYSPIVPLPPFATHRFPPDTAMPIGPFNPETSEAFTAAPVVALYSPIVSLPPFGPTDSLLTRRCHTARSTPRRARRSPPPRWWRCIHQSCRCHRS